MAGTAAGIAKANAARIAKRARIAAETRAQQAAQAVFIDTEPAILELIEGNGANDAPTDPNEPERTITDNGNGSIVVNTQQNPTIVAKTQQIQGAVQNYFVSQAPELAVEVVRIAKSRKAGPAVRLQASLAALALAGINTETARPAGRGDDVGAMASGELAVFVEAGARALELRRLRESAQDAEIIPGSREPVTIEQAKP